MRSPAQIIAEADQAIGRRHAPEALKPWFGLFYDSLFWHRRRIERRAQPSWIWYGVVLRFRMADAEDRWSAELARPEESVTG